MATITVNGDTLTVSGITDHTWKIGDNLTDDEITAVVNVLIARADAALPHPPDPEVFLVGQVLSDKLTALGFTVDQEN